MTKTNKNKNIFNLKPFLKKIAAKLKSPLTSMTILLVLFSIASGGFLYYQNSKDSASAITLGSSGSGGSNNVSINKVFVDYASGSAVFAENINVAKGGTVTVRLEYNNGGNFMVSNVGIQDTIPTGFTYEAGSARNCLTPSASEEVCSGALSDSLFASPGTAFTISPVAGLYDAASAVGSGGTATNATYGTLPQGKKRYYYPQSCRPVDRPQYAVTQGSFGPNGQGFYGDFPTSSNTPSNCTGNNFNDNFKVSISLVNQRYYYTDSCSMPLYTPTPNIVQGSFGALGQNFYGNSTTALGAPNGNCAGNGMTYNGSGATDTLGRRYYYVQACTATQASPSWVYTQPSYSVTGELFWGNSTTGSTTINLCTINNLAGTTGAIVAVDSLNNKRGRGYIEYRMKAPNTATKTGTNVNMSSIVTTGFNPFTVNPTDNYVANAENEITVLSDIATAVSNQVVYWNGTSEVSSLAVTPGQTVTIRAKYNNTGDTSLTASSLNIAVPTGFTINPATFKNCRVPSTPETYCSTTFTPTGSVISGNNVTISPSINLYDKGVNDGASGGGTGLSSTTGVLPIGQKRYIKQVRCRTSATFDSDVDSLVMLANNTTANPTDVCSPNSSYLVPDITIAAPSTTYVVQDAMDKRYTTLIKCQTRAFVAVTDDYRAVEMYNGLSPNNGAGSGDTIPTVAGCLASSFALPSGGGFTEVSGTSSTTTGDILGKRYIVRKICQTGYNAFGAPGTSGFYDLINDDYIVVNGAMTSNSIPPYDAVCTSNTYIRSNLSTYSVRFAAMQVLDLLDTTRGNGYIEFTATANANLTKGTYNTTLSTSSSQLVTTAVSASMTYSPATIGGKVFSDYSGDNLFNGNDGYLSNVQVFLKKVSDNSTVSSMFTLGNGNYEFIAPADNYYLEIPTLPSGYNLTTRDVGANDNIDSDFDPTTKRTNNFTATANQIITNLDAGMQYLTNLKIQKTSLGGANSDTAAVGRINASTISYYYDLIVSNVGSQSTLGTISINDTFSSRLTFISAGASGWVCSAVSTTLTCASNNVIAVSGSNTIRVYFDAPAS